MYVARAIGGGKPTLDWPCTRLAYLASSFLSGASGGCLDRLAKSSLQRGAPSRRYSIAFGVKPILAFRVFGPCLGHVAGARRRHVGLLFLAWVPGAALSGNHFIGKQGHCFSTLCRLPIAAMPKVDGLASAEPDRWVTGREHGDPKTDGVGAAGPYAANDAYDDDVVGKEADHIPSKGAALTALRNTLARVPWILPFPIGFTSVPFTRRTSFYR